MRMVPPSYENRPPSRRISCRATVWSGRSRADLADRYRQEAAHWSRSAEISRRRAAWHESRVADVRSMDGYVAPEDVARDRARVAEFEREFAPLGAEWKRLIGDWHDRPAEDLEWFER